MLKVLKSKNHSSIFTWDDKYLCSRVNPQKEATDWLKLYKEQINTCKNIIVLGLGCGYHILELTKVFPNKKIIVIETQKAIIDYFVKNNSMESSIINIQWIKNENELLVNSEIKRAVKEFFVVLYCTPIIKIFPSLEVYKSWLMGRNYESLQWLFGQRELTTEFNLVHLGIKNLNQLGPTLLDLQRCLNLKESVKSQKIHFQMEALSELIV
ncbi:MAG: hypothetical protein H6625_01630 [Bdellovibrionaceae bacterium]|nr:hypothetical protein [Pseudobdellovibrionaceae bacterium]